MLVLGLTRVLAVAPFALLFPRWFLPLRQTGCRGAHGPVFARHRDPAACHGFFGAWRRNHLISDSGLKAYQRHNLFQSLQQPTPATTVPHHLSGSLRVLRADTHLELTPAASLPVLSLWQRHETGKLHMQHRVIPLGVPCLPPTRRVYKQPIFRGLRGFHPTHHLQAAPCPRSAIFISIEPVCLSLRCSHRSHRILTRHLPPVTAVPT